MDHVVGVVVCDNSVINVENNVGTVEGFITYNYPDHVIHQVENSMGNVEGFITHNYPDHQHHSHLVCHVVGVVVCDQTLPIWDQTLHHSIHTRLHPLSKIRMGMMSV